MLKKKQFWGSDGEGGETYFHGDEATANFQRKTCCHFLDLLRFPVKFNSSSSCYFTGIRLDLKNWAGILQVLPFMETELKVILKLLGAEYEQRY